MLFKNVTEVNGKVIKALIAKASNENTEKKKLYERYKQTTEGVPILTRLYRLGDQLQNDKINNKLANDFVGEIVDMKVGFFCGVPISYTLDKSLYEQTETIEAGPIQKEKEEVIISPQYDEDLQVVNDFNKVNSIDDLNLETAKRATICGDCGRLLYSDVDDEDKIVDKIKLVEPWETIYIGESIEEPDYSIRYFDVIEYQPNGEEKKTSKAELYSANIIEYYAKNDNGEYVTDPDNPTVTHYFGQTPLFGFANNDEQLGDCNKVLTLIDAYDKLTSDMSSESEQWRLAYMIFKGCSIKAEDITLAKQTGAFGLPEGAEASFLTKEINNLFQENFIKLLENNIYRFSATPNMNDISFGGNLTGVAMKYKFRPFEDKCKRAELKFKKSFYSQYKKLCKVWADRGIDIDPLNIDFVFTRNYPQNLPEEILMLRDSKGIISEKTRFGLVSFIADPEKEMEQLKSEEQENLDNFILRNEAMKQTSGEDEEKPEEEKPDKDIKQSISNEVKE